ncbi:hypothetical protein [Terasakiella pusilla]|uniref:hypothetical protein n=1 Tax=Terasakiella pusilla TaxID=64973 RepID=UPI00048AADFC|nr:hypothetical protein [Terasakiella pusilla]
MKRALEKLVSVVVGLSILAVLVGGLILVFGGSILTGLTMVLGLPMAMPMTSALILGVLGVIILLKRRK